jgi:transposase
MFGVSAREMLAALIGGQNNPQVLAQMATRMRKKIPQLEEAFVEHLTDHHGFLLTKILGRIDALDVDIADLDTKIEALTLMRWPAWIRSPVSVPPRQR